MTADQIHRLRPRLDEYLSLFDDCFTHVNTRAHLATYVAGQLSDLPRKSVEPIALDAGVPPKTLQQFLSLLKWDHAKLRDRLQQVVAREHTSRRAIGIIDDTACPKQGDKTPGVKRQWCNVRGKTDNCVVTVHLAYTVGDFHCLLDSELFLPEDWGQDRDRCRAAGIPDAMTYRPKWRIALELIDIAVANGVRFAWLTCDEDYGGKPGFLRGLAARSLRYVAEVPTDTTGWLDPPRVTRRPYRKRSRGKGRKIPRLVSGSAPAWSVADHLRDTPALRDQPWVTNRVKGGTKGPMIWEAKRVVLIPKDEDGLPGDPLLLLVTRNVLKPDKLKFFLSNAAAGTRTEELLLVALSRWPVERCFEETKDELGLDHFEGRSYVGLKRHQAVTAATYLFLAWECGRLRGEKPGGDGLPGAGGGRGVGAVVVVRCGDGAAADRADGAAAAAGAAAQRAGAGQPHQADAPEVASGGNPAHKDQEMLMAWGLAL